MLSFFNTTGYRMTVSQAGYRVAICMSSDLIFGLFGSCYHWDRWSPDCFRGHLDRLSCNIRRDGNFFIITHVMYLVWVWKIFLAAGDWHGFFCMILFLLNAQNYRNVDLPYDMFFLNDHKLKYCK